MDDLLKSPNITLYGPIDDKAVVSFLDQLKKVLGEEQPVVVELTTEGGDAEGGRAHCPGNQAMPFVAQSRNILHR